MLNAINYTENPKFKPYKIGEILEFFSRKCVLEDNKNYQLVTVKRRNEGIVGRGIFKGKEIKTPTQFYLKAGDFLISKRQIVHGACEIVPEKFDGAIVSNEYSIIRGKEDIILTEYFNILSKTLKMKHHYFLSSYGIDIEKMVFNLELWKKGIVYLPSVEEQQKIVNVYTKLNKKIQLQQQKIDLLQEQKKGFLQKMFPKAGETQPEMRFGRFEGEWKNKNLGELMKVTSVKRIHQSDWKTGGVRFLRARDIVSAFKGEKTTDHLYISREKYEEYSKTSGKVTLGDLLVTGVGSIGVPLLITNEEPVYFKDGNVIWFKNNNKLDGNFFYYSFIGSSIQKFIKDVAGVGTVGTYTIESGRKTPIILPTKEEQVKIGNFLEKLDNVINLQKRKLELLQKQKKGFMQQMFI